jgi:hypothetical protein
MPTLNLNKTRSVKVAGFIPPTQRKSVPVFIPKILFQGKYLTEFGFNVGDQVEIIPESPGRITVEVVRSFNESAQNLSEP